MKADDDAFVNVPALVRELKGACLSAGCRRERIYFGREIRNNIVSAARLHTGFSSSGKSLRQCCPQAAKTRIMHERHHQMQVHSCIIPLLLLQ